MFRIEPNMETGSYILVSEDGDKLELRPDVWERLRDPVEIFATWKKLLQKWSIFVEKADLLKRECATDKDYRDLRTLIRTFKDTTTTT